jgi:hypothetical protein
VRIDKDAWTPDMGALGKGSETDEALIHGNKKEKIDRDLMSTVCISRIFQTDVNFYCTVGFMRKLKDKFYFHLTEEMFKRDVMGNSVYNRVGTTLCIYAMQLAEIHSTPRFLNEPVVRMEQVTNAIKSALDAQEVQGFAKAATGFKMEAIGISLSSTGVGVSVNGLNTGVTLLKDRTNSLENYIATLKSQQKAADVAIEAQETKTGVDVAALKFAANQSTM